MTSLEIVPLDPLVFGDGRPFGTEPGAQAAGGLALPPPSALAGALRTAYGRGQGEGTVSPEFWKATLSISSHGPLRRSGAEILVHAPSDMSPAQSADGQTLHLVRSRPRAYSADGEGSDVATTLPCQLPGVCDAFEPTKVAGPRWLTLNELEAWYSDGDLWGATGGDSVWTYAQNGQVPWPAHEIPIDLRAHVGIDSGTLAHEEGQLFVSKGAVFGKGESILARFGEPLGQGILPLGAERRLASLREGGDELWRCPASVRRRLEGATKVAMVLATPGHFDGGWRPGRLADTLGVGVELVSAVCRSREAVSGWDLAAKRPKDVRWLVPAGAVYFMKIEPGDGARLADRWLQPVSDDEPSRRDGFGLALFFATDW